MKCKLMSASLSAVLLLNWFPTALFASAAESDGSRVFVYDTYEVSYTVENAWGNTDVVNMDITNTGSKPIENWMLYFDMNGSVQYMVNAVQAAAEDGALYFKNAGYNAVIGAGETISITYAVENCTEHPKAFGFVQERAAVTDGYSVSIQTVSAWDSALQGAIVLTNETDAPLEYWELTVDTNGTIAAFQDIWGAEATETASGEYLLKATYAPVVEPGSSVSIGYVAVPNGTPKIVSSALTTVGFSQAVLDETRERITAADYTIADLETLNQNAYYPLEVVTGDDGAVTSVDGMFSEVAVVDEASAKDALENVAGLLGVKSVSSDLVLDFVFDSTDSEYKSYFFDEVYDDITVYGRGVTVVARYDGTTLSLDSNYIPLTDIDTDAAISAETILAEQEYDTVEPIIYTFDEYETAPILCYLCESEKESVILSAETGEVVTEIATRVAYEGDKEDIKAITTFTYGKGDDGDGCVFHTTEFENFVDETGVIITINDADVALSAIQAIHEDEDFELRVDFFSENTPNRLQFAATQEQDQTVTLKDGRYYNVNNFIYHFDQYYNDVRVFGREASVCNNIYGYISLDTNVIAIPEGFSTVPSDTLRTRAAEATGGNVTDDNLVIYTWDNSENTAAPRLAYVYDDLAAEKTLIIFENETYEKPLGKGNDEGGYDNVGTEEKPDYQPREKRLCYFPVYYDGELYSLSTTEHNPYSPEGVCVKPLYSIYDIALYPFRGTDNYFYIPEAVSAYVNALATVQWADEVIDFYNPESDYFVVGVLPSKFSDNAGLLTSSNAIEENYAYFGSKFDNSYTSASARDSLAHEFGHHIFDAFPFGGGANKMVKCIDECYADLFGAFVDGDWTSGENFKGNESVTESRNPMNEITMLIDFNSTEATDYYEFIPAILRPAYLMNSEYGFTMEELAELFYKSLSQGRYSATSTLNSVRRNVIKAAKVLHYDEDKLQKVIDAFNEVWDTNSVPDELTVVVSDFESPELLLTDAAITMKRFNSDEPAFSMTCGVTAALEPDWYEITVAAEGYLTYSYRTYKGYGSTELSVRLVKETQTNGTITVFVKDYVNRLATDAEVTLIQLTTEGEKVYGTYQTGAAVGQECGYTEPITVPAGYYVAAVKTISEFFYHAVTVSPGNNTSTTVEYSDLGLAETTDVHYFDVIENREGDTAQTLSLGGLKARSTYDANGDIFVRVNKNTSPTQTRYYVYCYQRPDETISVGFAINAQQRATLEKIAYGDENGVIDGSFHLEVVLKNRQDDNYAHTMIISASDLLDSMDTTEGAGFAEIATISLTDEGYIATPSEHQFTPTS